VHQSNRLAKLWSFAAVESGTAARLAGVSARLAIRRLVMEEMFGVDDAELPAETLVLGGESDAIVGDEERALALYHDIRTRARLASVHSLREPLAMLVTHLQSGLPRSGI
jgi:hypothetical protein